MCRRLDLQLRICLPAERRVGVTLRRGGGAECVQLPHIWLAKFIRVSFGQLSSVHSSALGSTGHKNEAQGRLMHGVRDNGFVSISIALQLY